ncbi:hypothetical protein GCM10027020_11430 [Nocardioides salsibiostraticola]
MGLFGALLDAVLPPRESARRLRAVADDPASATADDIAMLLLAHGVGEIKVLAVCDYLALTDIAPSVVWVWVLEFDGTELSKLLASDLTQAAIVEHLERRTRACYRAA